MVSATIRTGGTVLATALSTVYLLSRLLARLNRRAKHISPTEERVLILGASSGVGEALARQYASRGARVCVVARRADKITSVAEACGAKCIAKVADFTKAEDMVQLREFLLKEWGGLDTIQISAGVSALRPVMGLADIQTPKVDADSVAVQNAVDIAAKATQGNFVGPLVSALAFIPTLERTSLAPSILLVSSLAAVIPAPTRGLYAATKASSLLLFQSLAIEHPEIAFSLVLPSTIEGDFRASAVDSGPVREANPNKTGLKLDHVARKCISYVDTGTKGNIFLPWFPYAIGHYLYYLWPSFIQWRARKKYNFP